MPSTPGACCRRSTNFKTAAFVRSITPPDQVTPIDIRPPARRVNLAEPTSAQRRDLAELRWLVDGGSHEAALRLTELAAQRGDVDELRRLADEGSEEAEARLAERIRDMK